MTGTRPSAARDGGVDHGAPLRRAERAGLAHRAGGDEAVHAGVEQRGDVALERGDVDGAVGVEGVVTAGMMPGKRTSVLLVGGHVAAHPLEVLRGVEGGGGGVAVDDRLVDHAVLGRVDARAAAGRAIESSRSRCHSGWSMSAATWSARPSRTGFAVSDGEPAVEAAVAVVPGRRGRRRPRRRPSRRAAARPRRRGARRAGRRARRRRARAASRASSRSNGPASWRGGLARRRETLERVGATNEPEPGRVSSAPRSCSAAIASRTEARPDAEPPRRARARTAAARRARAARRGCPRRAARRSARSAAAPRAGPRRLSVSVSFWSGKR